ncbi:hypothetical protein D3C59_27850 [Streptomyces sp. SHP22-7]|nr:hypothetical protein D3C59_27850 [Streptomyces sp. SHP22-7]
MSGVLDFRTDLFDHGTAQALVDRFVRVLADAAAHPDRPLSRIDVLGPRERHRVVEEWNATAKGLAPATLPDLFERHVRERPDAEAVVLGDESLTYARLNARANRLARLLVERGAGPSGWSRWPCPAPSNCPSPSSRWPRPAPPTCRWTRPTRRNASPAPWTTRRRSPS